MKKFELLIDEEALVDIQQATNWYNQQLPELGTRFQAQVIVQINSLKIHYRGYAVRYKNVRCMLIKKFPYLAHFTIDEINGWYKYLQSFIQVVILKFG